MGEVHVLRHLHMSLVACIVEWPLPRDGLATGASQSRIDGRAAGNLQMRLKRGSRHEVALPVERRDVGVMFGAAGPRVDGGQIAHQRRVDHRSLLHVRERRRRNGSVVSRGEYYNVVG